MTLRFRKGKVSSNFKRATFSKAKLRGGLCLKLNNKKRPLVISGENDYLAKM